jgi:hypothetical protein
MESDRTVKKLLEGKTGEGRKTGRPPLRWMDDLELDLKNRRIWA